MVMFGVSPIANDWKYIKINRRMEPERPRKIKNNTKTCKNIWKKCPNGFLTKTTAPGGPPRSKFGGKGHFEVGTLDPGPMGSQGPQLGNQALNPNRGRLA